MAILIDGYNLLYAAGMLGRKVGPGSLERARNALLHFLVASLDASERRSTTVVFDAPSRSAGLPREQAYQELAVLYSVGYENADALIEELIRNDSAPRRLLVVSSDHQIQRAARRRRATAVDSDRWFDDLSRRRASHPPEPPDHKPAAPKTPEALAYWLQAFSDVHSDDASLEPRRLAPPPLEPERAGEPESRTPKAIDEDAIDEDFLNPFPPGYAEDLLEDE